MRKNITVKTYYKDKNFDILENRLKILYDNMERESDEKNIRNLTAELYSFYLQIIEIFLINTFAISEKDLWNNLFLSNMDLKEKAKKLFFTDNLKFLNKTYTNIFLGFFRIKDELKHVKYLEEILRDYLMDYRFLNAYKHGLRIEGKSEGTLSVQKTEDDKWNLMVQCNSSVNYLDVKKIAKNYREVIESKIWFNKERIFVKCKYLIRILKLARGEAIKERNYSKILSKEDIKIIKTENEALRFSSPIMQLVKSKISTNS